MGSLLKVRGQITFLPQSMTSQSSSKYALHHSLTAGPSKSMRNLESDQCPQKRSLPTNYMSYRKKLWTVSEGTNTAPTYQQDRLLRPTVLTGARVVRRSPATFGFGKCLMFYNGFGAKIARATSRNKRRSAKSERLTASRSTFYGSQPKFLRFDV